MEDTAAFPGRVLTCARGSPKDAPPDGASWDLRRGQGLSEQCRSGARDPRPAPRVPAPPRSPAPHPPRAAGVPAIARPLPSPAAEAATRRRLLPGRRQAPPRAQPHVVRANPSFRRRGLARHGRAAGGRERLPARAPEPAAGARYRQGPRGGNPWLLPGPPSSRPASPP